MEVAYVCAYKIYTFRLPISMPLMTISQVRSTLPAKCVGNSLHLIQTHTHAHTHTHTHTHTQAESGWKKLDKTSGKGGDADTY